MQIKKILKAVFFISATFLIFSAAWVFSLVYRDTSTALQRAENFIFSRMAVARLGEQGSVRFFYSTNRGENNGTVDLNNKFSNQRESALKFGFFDAHVEPTVGLGMFINPSEWFQNEEIKIKNVEESKDRDFIERLRALVQASPQRSLLIVVHGFREAFPSALRKTAFVGHILDINSPVLLFDWPGNQGSSLSGYRNARSVAKASGEELAALLEIVVREIRPDKVWLVANSMGGEVVVRAIHQLALDPRFADEEYEFEDIILTAPDISQEEFTQRFKQEVAALTRNLTVYVSSNDRALVMSRLVNRDSRLGESTLNPGVLQTAERITSLMDPDSDLITLVDVTPVNRTRNFHNFSLETPEFFDDLFLRLANEQTPQSRRIYGLQTPTGRTYWVLTPGR